MSVAPVASPIETPTPAFFFSDVHLGAQPPETERAKEDRLLRFLEMVRVGGRTLFCLGDLFDFWFEYETMIPSRYFGVLRRLQELSDAGVRLYFMGGNHDYWVRHDHRPGFLEREIGFSLLGDEALVRAGGLRLLLFHGDGVGSRDLGYRLLKRLLRNRLAIASFRWVHPDLARRIGGLTSRISRRRDDDRIAIESSRRIREHAELLLAQRGDVDVVVAGHSHVPEDLTWGDRRYLNLGDWIHHASYAVVDEGRLSLETFDPRTRTGPDPVLLA
jgi:UDP-2,3-diacylglucosamine hydrolase